MDHVSFASGGYEPGPRDKPSQNISPTYRGRRDPARDNDKTARTPRAPNPDKKVSGKDDLHSAITRQTVAEEQKVANLVRSKSKSDPPPAAPLAPSSTSPLASPLAMSSQQTALRSAHGSHMTPQRTTSIDSNVSWISSLTSATPRAHASGYRVPQDQAEDAATLIAAAGSAEVALQKVLNEKQQAASHNAQLWRLVEKQRTMILGLNKDLEKSLKEKERYRRKLKDHLTQSIPAPALISAQVSDSGSREASVSPAGDAASGYTTKTLRKGSDGTESLLSKSSLSDTPLDAGIMSTSVLLPASPQSSSSTSAEFRMADRDGRNQFDTAPRIGKNVSIPVRRDPGSTPPMTPLDHAASPRSAKETITAAQSAAISPSSQSFSSPKTRKAPPAPLKLNPPKPEPQVRNNIIDASDSEYEENPESARGGYLDRGRRKTREDDDRQREMQAEKEERSRSKKDRQSKSKSKSKSKSRSEQPEFATPAPADMPAEPSRQQQRVFEATANPADIVRNRAVSDATALLRKKEPPAAMLSPGLPMSPRPSDRPPNSPMPRSNVSIPMSPKVGLPLSPRAPRHALPLPPQTPLSINSPHLDRAKAYHQHLQPYPQAMSSVAERLMPPGDGSPGSERPSTSSERTMFTPGEVYQGFMSDQYPGLLLPPNALASIYVKTASSRMRPSRASFIAPRPGDENPVFTLAVHERSEDKQLWRVEKTFASLALLDQQVKAVIKLRDRLPDKALFAGHAPAKIDARRMALNYYFDRMLDAMVEEKAALIFCKFLSTDAVGGDGDCFGGLADARPDSPVAQLRPNRAGYLTKRGKNFGGWKARYFVLDGPSLKYFEGPGGAHLGSIRLQSAQIGKQSSTVAQSSHEDEDNQFRHAFLILEPKKKDSTSLVRHVLCAESDEERDAWVEALLQYVDYRDDEDTHLAQQAQQSKTEVMPRSPRLRKSMNDLRSGSGSSQGTGNRSADLVRTVNYSEVAAGDAPVMGMKSPLGSATPSPPYDKTSSAEHTGPNISGPTNLQVIQNTGDWGMKAPPTPGGKDKKRSVFALPFTRGRSSSDVMPGEGVKSPGLPPDKSNLSRAVFGLPLADAAAITPAPDGASELPAVVYRCIQYLTLKNAIAEEGIFRLSGSNTVIRALKDRFNTEGDVNLVMDINSYDVHAVASLLKLYLRELPASILTRNLHLDFLHCLELMGDERIFALNGLVNRLPGPNRALLEALSAFMLTIVNNVGVNKMNVRNLGVVFSPTLNVPGPLISLFVEEQHRIFGDELHLSESSPPTSSAARHSPASSTDLRSPRKQMFTDLPTPAYNQTAFQHGPGGAPLDDTGMVPLNPAYAYHQMAPQGDGGFGSLNDALRSPTIYNTTGTGAPTPRDAKAKRRESRLLGAGAYSSGPQKKSSMSRLREEQGTSF
ncbi:RhoGAP-domain-containing protein [Zymoseptoria brevis]|uniref:RhoGAP-domain-containing protein n=1 Tax=Zymoseptoria brevis TaxID=1047168 RepID=A0A0F4GXC2_9PEZI|nr:RhoGAP-domain-containing protein [Zymoseptoria brevis]